MCGVWVAFVCLCIRCGVWGVVCLCIKCDVWGVVCLCIRCGVQGVVYKYTFLLLQDWTTYGIVFFKYLMILYINLLNC